MGGGKRLAVVWRGDAEARQKAAASKGRLGGLFDALAEAGVEGEPAVFCEQLIDEVREQLLGVDGVIVFVNPLDAACDRSTLDSLLREVADSGVRVSAHPDVVLGEPLPGDAP